MFFKNHIFLDEGVKYTEDIDCTLKLFLKAKKIDLLEQPFYIYRQARKGAATTSYKSKRVEDTMNFVIKWNRISEEIQSQELKQCLINFIQYQYSIVVGMLFLLKKQEKDVLYLKVKQYEKLLEDASGKKGKLVHYSYKIFGFNITGRMMGVWIKNKEKIRR